MNKFIIILLSLSAAPLLGMQTTAKKHKREKSTEQKKAELMRNLGTIHKILLLSLEDRPSQPVNDVVLAGYIDESFKALADQRLQAKGNIKLERELAKSSHRLLADALKLAQSLKEESDNLYTISLRFSELPEPYQEGVVEALTQLNSLYNSLVPLLDYVDSSDFVKTMNGSREKIDFVRTHIL